MSRYTAWCETEGSAASVDAVDAEDAAMQWAALHDADGGGNYIVDNCLFPVVHVRAPDGTLSRWRVEGEWDPIYSASEMDEGEGDDR